MPRRPPKPPGVEAVPRYKEKQSRATRKPARALFDAVSQLTKVQPSFGHYADFRVQTTGLDNDRGAAILLATNVENALESTLARILRIDPDASDELFGFNAPLHRFSDKVTIGYALRIYGPETRFNLDCIRAIRNAFAHAKIPIHFKTLAIAHLCDAMTMPVELSPYVGGRDAPEPGLVAFSTPHKTRFRRICERTASNLLFQNLGGMLEIDPNAFKASVPPDHVYFGMREPLP